MKATRYAAYAVLGGLLGLVLTKAGVTPYTWAFWECMAILFCIAGLGEFR